MAYIMTTRKNQRFSIFFVTTVIISIWTETPKVTPKQMESPLPKCHQEHIQDVSLVNHDGSEENFNLGDVALLECNATGQSWVMNHQKRKASFAMYPHSKRTCVRNGIGNRLWSGPIPICINTNSDINGSARKVSKFDIRDCKVKHGRECPPLDTWRRIGEPNSHCSPVDVPSNTTRYEFLLLFVRPFYFSFVTFPSEDFLGIELFAETKSLISNLSSEAHKFLSGHHSQWRIAVNNNREKCALTNTAIFTDSLRLHFSVKGHGSNYELSLNDNIHSTYQRMLENFSFYRILKCFETEALEPRECVKEPIILNAKKDGQYSNKSHLKFRCDENHDMVDPDTNYSSNGELRCVESDWMPYPYPVCKPSKATTNYVTVQPEPTTITPIASFPSTLIKLGASNIKDHPVPTQALNFDYTQPSEVQWGYITGYVVLGCVIVGLVVVIVYLARRQNLIEANCVEEGRVEEEQTIAQQGEAQSRGGNSTSQAPRQTLSAINSVGEEDGKEQTTELEEATQPFLAEVSSSQAARRIPSALNSFEEEDEMEQTTKSAGATHQPLLVKDSGSIYIETEFGAV